MGKSISGLAFSLEQMARSSRDPLFENGSPCTPVDETGEKKRPPVAEVESADGQVIFNP
jgi:hypothetical protein